ncbi:beta-eliminating lyase-related protein [Providencia rustigianii]|uniref:beta-eliminating lyase-related protein n=1 Tax=Providencia rustigianii TaxID=158850 RepID=UPI0022435FCF|nr:beta-eliminating lyase-related protein [Providencia rustigianii]
MITIDLRSDTLTRINKEDLNNINYNYISDDCYNEDIYVKELESYISQLFNKESALFMPSGTMSNQIGLKILSSLGDEVITEVGYHICFFESAQTSILSGLIINNVKTKNAAHLASIASKYFQLAYPVETNIVMVKTQNADKLVHSLKSHGILSTAWTADIVRFVTSSNISESMVMQLDPLFQKIESF